MKKTVEDFLEIPEFLTSYQIINLSQINYFEHCLDDLTDDSFIPLPSEWAQDNRYLPSSVSENYGKWNRRKVKHIADILDEVHPDRIATHIAVLKSVQSGLTVSLGENAMGFFTKYRLGSVAFFTSTKNVGKARSSSALDIMIDNSGLDDLIKPASNRTNRKSADTAFAKEFSGGIRWQLSSYNSIADMKSNTFNLLVCDEWDEAKDELKGQGDIAGIIEGRTMGVRMFKILYISTSSEMETSRIYKAFIEGDQQKYFIPCPHCGGMQHLKMKFKGDQDGLTFEMRINKRTGAKELDPMTVRYTCKHCDEDFFEFHKNKAIEDGEWRPTWQESPYVPKSPKHRSYHIPGLLSPFLSWNRICQQFINTNFGQDLLKYKDFVINYLGEPWARIESSASWEDLKNRADEYTLGEVPEGGLMLFGGCDVQGDRLELAIVAVGAGMEKWVVDYQIFYGNPAEIKDPSWDALHYFVYDQRYTVQGAKVGISLVAIDTGYNPAERREKDWEAKSHIVHDFVAHRTDRFMAVKGTGNMKNTSDLIKERSIPHGLLNKRYDIATPIIKEMLMMIIGETEGPNSIHFPKYRMYNNVRVSMQDEFFQQFLSERYQEIGAGKMGWKKIRARNEVWDVVIYAIAAMYFRNLQVWSDEVWEDYAMNLRNIANKK